MSKYGYSELEALYENNLASGYSDTRYIPNNTIGDKNSYGTKGMIPTTVAGNAGTAWSVNLTNSNDSFRSFSEEEDERVKDRQISVQAVVDEVNKKLAEASEIGMIYACEYLTDILNFLKSE